MALTDDRTTHLDLPLPHQFNDLPDDVERLRDALTALDTKAREDDELHQLISDELIELNGAIGALSIEHEETITLIEDQTVIDLTELTSTVGATVFVEGVRLKKTEWTADPEVVTRLTLSTTYPAGHDVTVVRRLGGV